MMSPCSETPCPTRSPADKTSPMSEDAVEERLLELAWCDPGSFDLTGRGEAESARWPEVSNGEDSGEMEGELIKGSCEG